MAKQKTYGLPTLTPVNYDARTGTYNDPLKGVGYDASSGNYYDAFAEDGGEYVNPQQYKKKYGLRALAQGGYVQEGEPVIVGDGGQPELFVPDQSGYVYPQVPQQQQQQKPLSQMTMEEARAAGYLPPPTPTSQIAGSSNGSAESVYRNFSQMRPTEQLRYRDSNRMTWRYDNEKGPGYDNPITGFIPEGSQGGGSASQGYPPQQRQSYQGQQVSGGSQPQYRQQPQQPIAPTYDDRSSFTPGYQPPASRSFDDGGPVSGRMVNGKFQRNGNSSGSSYRGGNDVTQADALEGYASLNNAYRARNLGTVAPDGRQMVDPHYPMDGPYGLRAMMALDPDPNRPLQTQDEYGNWRSVTGAEKYANMSEQMRVNRKAQGMRGVNPGDPDYGSRYYSVQADNPEAVRSMPVPQNYPAPLGVTNQPNDPGMRALEQSRQQTGYSPQSGPDQYPNVPMQTGQSRGRGVGLSVLQQSQSGQPGYSDLVQRGPVTGETDDLVQRGSTAGGFDNPVQRGPATGLSAMQQQGQQPQQPYVPSQVQTAQSLMDTIQNGTPRQSILAAAKAGGYGDAELIQGQDGSMQLVTRGSGPVYSGGQVVDEGTQPKRIASFRPGKEGLRDVSDFLHTVLTPQQQKANEGLVKYTEEQANRQEDHRLDQPKFDLEVQGKQQSGAKDQLGAVTTSLSWLNTKYGGGSVAFDPNDSSSSLAALLSMGKTKAYENMTAKAAQGDKEAQQDVETYNSFLNTGHELARGITSGQYMPRVGLGQAHAAPAPAAAAAPTSAPSPAPTAAPTAAPAQATIPPQLAAKLREGIVTTFDNRQKWTLQNGKPTRVH